MFEFEQYDPKLSQQYPPDRTDGFVENTNGTIRSFSLLNWGEHCVECAFPACYKTCNLYEPRADGRCRRFRFGIQRNRRVRASLPYSAYVRFKDSSHLWSQGNATQLPRLLTRALLFVQDALVRILILLDRNLLRRVLGRTYVLLGFQALRRRLLVVLGCLYRLFPRPQVFRFELFNPSDEPTDLLFFVRNRSAQYEAGHTLRPGFNVLEYSVADIEQRIRLDRPFKMSFYLTQAQDRELYICFASFVRYRPQPSPAALPESPKPKKVKCLVWDLDRTLWDGILLESETGRMQLKDGVRTLLAQLDQRGILLSIASKNDPDNAVAALQALEIWDYFLVPQINWEPKGQSVRRIADELNIGIDTLAFIDDSPFERDEVQTQCPSVLCLDAAEYMTLLGRPEFAGDSSSDSAQRRRFYQTEIVRKTDRATHGYSIDEFLAACDIRVHLTAPTESEIQRIHELVQRTNQLNFSGIRYTRDDVVAIIRDPQLQCYVVRCRDRYGDYGIVGFCVVAAQAGLPLIRDMMLSCRIQSKKIEHAIVGHLADRCFAQGHRRIQARYCQTARNKQAGRVFDDLGFVPADGCQDPSLLALDRDTPRDPVRHVRILEEAPEE